MGKLSVSGLAGVALCLFAAAAMAAAPPPAFEPLEGFPTSPGPSGFNIAADALGDGRFVLYDGDTVWLQDGPGADGFTPFATGFAGDPAFISTGPDGHTVILGTGFTGDGALYQLDAYGEVPEGLAPFATVPGNYAGGWLSSTVFLVEGTIDGAPGLVMLDLAAVPVSITPVVINKEEFSASFTVDRSGGLVYASAFPSGELRAIGIDALFDAAANGAPLEWAETGELLGLFNTAGPSAVSHGGTLLFGGLEIEFLNPQTRAVEHSAVPAEADELFYAVAYNANTGRILAIGSDFSTFPASMSGYVSVAPYELPPAPGPLLRLVLALIAFLLDLILQVFFGGMA